jgi:hypothetical protein
MILVDTSVWINHFRKSDPDLVRLLERGAVASHPFVIGEIALGSIKNRTAVLDSLKDLPTVATATDEETLAFIEAQSLAAKGIGYLDAHLLAAVRLTPDARLWTRDKTLNAASDALGLSAVVEG